MYRGTRGRSLLFMEKRKLRKAEHEVRVINTKK